jgi:Protein of unknown function (DUF2505)
MTCVIEMLTRRVDYARLSQVLYSEPFNRELMSAIDLKERVVRERSEQPDGKLYLRTYIAPRVDLPAVIERLVKGHAVGYEETVVFDPATRHARSSIQTPVGDMFQVAADTYFTDVAQGVRTRIELQVKVKVFGVGGIAEKFVCNETQKRYVIIEQVLQRYLDEGRDQSRA